MLGFFDPSKNEKKKKEKNVNEVFDRNFFFFGENKNRRGLEKGKRRGIYIIVENRG